MLSKQNKYENYVECHWRKPVGTWKNPSTYFFKNAILKNNLKTSLPNQHITAFEDDTTSIGWEMFKNFCIIYTTK